MSGYLYKGPNRNALSNVLDKQQDNQQVTEQQAPE